MSLRMKRNDYLKMKTTINGNHQAVAINKKIKETVYHYSLVTLLQGILLLCRFIGGFDTF